MFKEHDEVFLFKEFQMDVQNISYNNFKLIVAHVHFVKLIIIHISFLYGICRRVIVTYARLDYINVSFTVHSVTLVIERQITLSTLALTLL